MRSVCSSFKKCHIKFVDLSDWTGVNTNSWLSCCCPIRLNKTHFSRRQQDVGWKQQMSCRRMSVRPFVDHGQLFKPQCGGVKRNKVRSLLLVGEIDLLFVVSAVTEGAAWWYCIVSLQCHLVLFKYTTGLQLYPSSQDVPQCAALINKTPPVVWTITCESSSLTTMHHRFEQLIFILWYEEKCHLYSALGDLVRIHKRGVSWHPVGCVHCFPTEVSNTLVALLHLRQAEWDPPLSYDE